MKLIDVLQAIHEGKMTVNEAISKMPGKTPGISNRTFRYMRVKLVRRIANSARPMGFPETSSVVCTDTHISLSAQYKGRGKKK